MRIRSAHSCHTVRSWVSAAHDDELSVERQVAMDSHLASCTACRRTQEELASLGVALRRGASEHRPDDTAFTGLSTEVLARTPSEQHASWRRRVREVVREGPVLWIVGGALTATMTVTVLSANLLSLATPVHPRSLAGILQASAAPPAVEAPLPALGSNANPIRLISSASLPNFRRDGRAASMLTQPWPPLMLPNLALTGIVTQEGQFASVEILRNGSYDADLDRAVSRLVSGVRFEPVLADGAPVAAEVVWLLERTTVHEGETEET